MTVPHFHFIIRQPHFPKTAKNLPKESSLKLEKIFGEKNPAVKFGSEFWQLRFQKLQNGIN